MREMQAENRRGKMHRLANKTDLAMGCPVALC
jgi:hypothetical protein